ncbi:MAG: hypothetical protein ABJG47_14750 [Ekhidna sp.]
MKKEQANYSQEIQKVAPIRTVPFPIDKDAIRIKYTHTPSLSDFLRGYMELVKEVHGVNNNSQVHQLDIKAFDIDISTGIAGIKNNEIILAL